MAEYIEREAVEKAVFIKQDQERQHWIEYLKQFRGTRDYSSKEQAVDNWFRGYGEAVENLLAIFETLPTSDVESSRVEAYREFAKFLIDKAENGVISIVDLPEYVIEMEGKVK